MFPEQLQKILDLIKKTGDRVVIFDSRNPDDSYVVMDFNNYANQAARGASAPAAAPSHNSPEPAAPKAELSPMSAKSDNLTEEDLTDKINREISMWKNRDVSSFLGEENKSKNGWQIPPQVKDKAQEVE
ncbi:MAG: hypothetical protein WC456_02385 [Patescibacteria group bacterium]